MRVAICCNWEAPYQKTKPDGVFISMNIFDPAADWVVDLSSLPFSDLSRRYPPEKRIYVTGEPSGYMGYTPQSVQRYGEYYKGALFTWHKALAAFPQTRRFRMGTSWVGWETSPSEKKFGIGGMFSGKSHPSFPGYALRHKIVSEQARIAIPSMVFHPDRSWKGVSFDYPQPSKRPALEFMFHFAVENCREDGYFTEKLLDCLTTYSIPVYYGDPLIGDTFVMDGIVVLDPSRFVEQVNGLTPEFYSSRLAAVVENRRRAEPFWHFEENVINHIREHLTRK